MESSSFGMHAAGFAAPLPVISRIAPASHEHDEYAHASTGDAVHKVEDREREADEVNATAHRTGC